MVFSLLGRPPAGSGRLEPGGDLVGWGADSFRQSVIRTTRPRCELDTLPETRAPVPGAVQFDREAVVSCRCR